MEEGAISGHMVSASCGIPSGEHCSIKVAEVHIFVQLLPMLASALEFGGAPSVALGALLQIGKTLDEASFTAQVDLPCHPHTCLFKLGMELMWAEDKWHLHQYLRHLQGNCIFQQKRVRVLLA